MISRILRAISAAIRSALSGVWQTVRRVVNGVSQLVSELVPRSDAQAIADAAIGEPVNDNQPAPVVDVVDRHDQDHPVNRAIRVAAAIALNGKMEWPGAQGIPAHVQSWLYSLSVKQAQSFCRLGRQKQEAIIGGRMALDGLPKIPLPGVYMTPPYWIERGPHYVPPIAVSEAQARAAAAIARKAAAVTAAARKAMEVPSPEEMQRLAEEHAALRPRTMRAF